MAQIEDEIRSCLDFLSEVYGIFGFTFELHLSTRPEKFLGEIEVWDKCVWGGELGGNSAPSCWLATVPSISGVSSLSSSFGAP